MDECLALADLCESINLMPLLVWNTLSLPELSPTCMTLELADRSISRPVGVTKDVFVKVGAFHFPADFVVVDFDADPRVPLILERSFLKTGRALIDVYKGELSLRVNNEAMTFNLDKTSRYSANYNDMTANRIDVIDMACEEYSQEVLGFSDVIVSGNPTPYYDPIVSTSSPTLTPSGDSDFLLEEVDAFLAFKNDPTSPKVDHLITTRRVTFFFLKSSIDEPPEVEIKDLPHHLEYAFLEGDDKLPTRPRKYSELTLIEEIQADCDVKETNIILQGLPPEVYALVSNHRIAKELWERIQLLMQGTSLIKQERKCKLYDEFNKFAYKKGETLRDFYLRFLLLLNDMNIYNVKLEQLQENNKFLNTHPLEWRKFVTDVKLVHDLYTTNIDQLHAYLGQHEFYTNELTNNNNLPQLDSGLTILVFKQGDDPIDAINHMMLFLSAVVTSHYHATNNQLKNSLNPRQQATINDGRVTLQPIHMRQLSFTMGTTRTYTPGTSKSNYGKQKTIICYNYKEKGHMSKQCTKPKRKRDGSWFSIKCYALAEIHNPDDVNNNMINQSVQVMPSSKQSNIVNHSETKITSSNSSAQQGILILSVIEQLKTQVINCTKINLDNKSVNDTLTAELERYKEQVKVLKEGKNV
nr:reverse transcriptase domain-containing protein [Tanacetum cinerariifolium]